MRIFGIIVGIFSCGASLSGQSLGEASAPERPAPESETWTGEELTPFIAGLVVSEESGPAIGLPFDIHDREGTRTYYNAEYALSEGIDISWTGSHSPPTPGTTNPAYRTGIIRRVNLFRAFAGVPANVTENATYSAKSQEAALMMSIANTLSHTPTAATFPDYYTADGAEAAGKSNLFLGSNGSSSIDGYIHDPGSNNLRVGHRNWILDPARAEMGTGDVPRVGPGQNRSIACGLLARRRQIR